MSKQSAIDFSANNEPLRELLVEKYRQLPTLEQLIVQLFSIVYEPVNRTALIGCLNLIGCRDRNGSLFTSQSLKPYIDRLLEMGLLTQNSRQGSECHPLLVEIATRDAVLVGRFEPFCKAVQEYLSVPERGSNKVRYFTSVGQLLREVRIGIYRHDIKYINKQMESCYETSFIKDKDKILLSDIYGKVCNNPFDPIWFRTLPEELYENALISILDKSVMELSPVPEAFTLLQEECAGEKKCSHKQRILLIEQLLLRGDWQSAEKQIEHLRESNIYNAAELQGWLAFARGEYDLAIEQYTIALSGLKKTTSKRKIYFQSISGVFFVLALLKQGERNRLSEAQFYCMLAQQTKHWLSSIYKAVVHIVQIQQGDISAKEEVVRAVVAGGHQGLETLVHSLCLYWADADRAKQLLPRNLELFYEKALAAGYDWLAMEAAQLYSRLKPSSHYAKQLKELRRNSSIPALVDLLQPQEPWELCLTALANLYQEPIVPVKPDAKERLAWFITFYTNSWMLQPREQTLGAKGEWSRGRNIALKRLAKNPGEFGYLTPQDLRVCAHIQAYSQGWGSSLEYRFAEKAIASLVGHPLVFWEDSLSTRVEIVRGEPELLVKKQKGEKLTLQFLPELKENKDIVVVKESPTRLKVISITAAHRRIAEIIGKQNRLEVPAKASERVLAAINAVSKIVTIHSDIGGGVANAEEVPAQSIPHCHLLPAGNGLKVALLARPFPQGGSYYRPGAGGETVIAEIDGKRLQTSRNLNEEATLARAVIAACPTLARQPEANWEWLVEEPEDCLELLLELQALGDTVVLGWPEGEKLRVKHQANLQNLQLTLRSQKDWFAASGELKLDEDLVLDMQHLLELLEQTPGRFVPLGDGEFLALTAEFRQRLDELKAFSEKRGKELRLHPLAAVGLTDWIDEVGELKADKNWNAQVQRLKEIQNWSPELPSTLQAELRDYQIEGFQWLARLASWGVGACLADDMGVGKTLQALAAILTNAASGPTLVVAPTSVCMNWVSEAQRFAPTLNPIQFGSGSRQKVLDSLQPFDLLICSYGMLQQEEVAAMLAKVQWQTVVLDEAQWIKNFATKRSQAAMKLQACFKLITTGTPIENHLSELWNLFRFINPGLLGSMESFNQRFGIPIERYGDEQARLRLKKLIQPFILRRTKDQVLQELPSRTEILLHVELSREEMAFYEALRQRAIAVLSESDAPAGQKHLQVLAEIMKLRRACCNARLVMPDALLPSSKLELFGEVLGELLENQHKALVFSQFVDHLHIIRQYLDEQKISYQYLDGSTSVKERKKRVDAFQSGDGDVFLISLKAGGTGLNLTAADYVIHMDPWWNPAVEDQASDRAHRIGQQRPVTIYRLVTKNTIEEKIVDLHQHKRDLADSLLEGAEMTATISTEELLRLIQET